MNAIHEQHQRAITYLADNFISLSWRLTRTLFCDVEPHFAEEQNDILTQDEDNPDPVLVSFWKVDFSPNDLENATKYYESTLHR